MGQLYAHQRCLGCKSSRKWQYTIIGFLRHTICFFIIASHQICYMAFRHATGYLKFCGILNLWIPYETRAKCCKGCHLAFISLMRNSAFMYSLLFYRESIHVGVLSWGATLNWFPSDAWSLEQLFAKLSLDSFAMGFPNVWHACCPLNNDYAKRPCWCAESTPLQPLRS